MNLKRLLYKLEHGDIIHANYGTTASLICLITKISGNSIHARRVTTQTELSFSRDTGVGEIYEEKKRCVIDSIAPLPPEIHNIILSIDRKFRLLQNPEQSKLTDEEKSALIFVGKYYENNPL